MKRPYILCHMMMSLDGRIDCGMTSKIKGSEEYYRTLEELLVQATLSGRVTAQLEMAEKGKFVSENKREDINQECFSKKKDSKRYQVIFDTKGTLLWKDDRESKEPLVIILSEKASKEYLSYLDCRSISYIVTGKETINLKRACEILCEEFHIERMALVGGGNINGSFLEEGLIDEISILLGPGIDARKGMTCVFDGRKEDKEPIDLSLMDVKSFQDGAIYIRYKVKSSEE